MRVTPKKLSIFSFTILAALVTTSAFTKADSFKAEEEIRSSMHQFSEILNAKGAPEILMEFLHENIHHDASFVMNIANPDAGNGQKTETTLSKADYINSFLYGPRMIDKYNMHIDVEYVESLPRNDAWVSKIRFTENGYMNSPYQQRKKSKPFTSFTTCDAVYSLEGSENLVLEKATCHTEILSEQDV